LGRILGYLIIVRLYCQRRDVSSKTNSTEWNIKSLLLAILAPRMY
jgi:hypothetical protein